MNERVSLSIEGGIASVVLNRPEKMNALDHKMFEGLVQACLEIRSDKRVRVVVISGKGEAFCAGLDKQSFSKMLESKDDASQNVLTQKLATRTRGIANDVQYAVWAWRELEVPVIAAVHGVAVGGGFQIALAADMRYAAPETRFSIMEIKWGLVPDMSSTQLMRHLAGEDIVRELTYTGRIFQAEEARELGFVTRICDQPLAHAMEVAQQIAERNPQAIRACKRILNAANYVSEAEGLLMESREQDKIIGQPNQIEAVMAELQKRPPVFKD
ncbi:MAG: crotonase/enoyl-CoA hydratase family protein [Gammaproteobacteria bacterium]|nr:crotonase/enoyl-CoA hydratase family protein [Gammaproteobacteria bacterium]